jgi:hypothetical protein
MTRLVRGLLARLPQKLHLDVQCQAVVLLPAVDLPVVDLPTRLTRDLPTRLPQELHLDV